MPANYTHINRPAGTVLTDTIYNEDHQNHVTNGVPLQLDDYSVNTTQMQVNTDPGEVGTESLPTSLAGELERIRFAIKECKNALSASVPQWYSSPTSSAHIHGTIASAATTDINTVVAHSMDVTGAITITSLGVAPAGVRKKLHFTGILILTHNATSLILPGSANITTAVGDTAEFRSLGAGNWKCLWYQAASGNPINIRLRAYTVAPSGATAAEKTLADYVGDGVNDQTAIHNALTAAGNAGAMVILLPGSYTCGAVCNLATGGTKDNFIFYAEGTDVTGAGGTADTFSIGGGNGTYRFGRINHPGSGAAIRSAGGLTEGEISWHELIQTGLTHTGKGFFADATATGAAQSVNRIRGAKVHGFDHGISFQSTTNIDTCQIDVNYIRDCNVCVYEVKSGAGSLNSNIWNVNVDATEGAVAGSIGIQTNSTDTVWQATIGGLSGTQKNIQLDSGALNQTFFITPMSQAAITNGIVDNSASPTNRVMVGMPMGLAIQAGGDAAKDKLAKFSSSKIGILDNSGIPSTSTGTGNVVLSASPVLTGDVVLGALSTVVFDAVGNTRVFKAEKLDASTVVGGSLATLAIVNKSIATDNVAQLNFAAVTGANPDAYSSAIIAAIFGPRTNGQYPIGQMAFMTSSLLNTAPTEKMRLNNTGNLLTGGLSAAAAGYTANGDITLPAAGAIRANNTAKAWCNIGVAAGVPSINDSFNVISVTDVGVGIVDLNLQNAVSISGIINVTLPGAVAMMNTADFINTTTIRAQAFSSGGGGGDPAKYFVQVMSD